MLELRLQTWTRSGLEHRLAEQRDRAVRSFEIGHERESLGTRWAGRSVAEQLEGDLPSSCSLARSEMSICGRKGATATILTTILRCRPEGVLEELSGDDRSAPGDRNGRRRLELRGDLGVRPPALQARCGARARQWILDDLGQALVRVPPSLRRRCLVQHGGEQRMRETDDAVRELDHVVRERRRERIDIEECGRRPPMRAREQSASRVSSVSPSSRARTSTSSVSGTGSGCVGSTTVPRARGKFEREERVPAGHLVQAEQCRPREHPAQPSLQDPVQRAETERANVQTLDAAAVDDKLELGHRDAVPEPAGEEDADVLVLQSPQRKRKSARR